MKNEDKKKRIVTLLFGSNNELEMQRERFSTLHWGSYNYLYFENPSNEELENVFKRNDILEYQIFSVGVFSDLVDLHRTVRIAHENGKKIEFLYENVTSSKKVNFQQVLYSLMLYYNPEQKLWI
ncbi:hypothetical protein ACLIA0_14920 [Bacillaceae bacterium W0354]